MLPGSLQGVAYIGWEVLGNLYLLNVFVVPPCSSDRKYVLVTLAGVSTCWLVISSNLISLVAVLEGYTSCSLTTPKHN